jgi:acyl-CoA thioester hydrolase
MTRAAPNLRENYPHHLKIQTRWADNDVYGHVNNSVYYFYIDTVVNRYLIDNGLLEIGKSEVIGLAVESGCNFFSPVSFPDTLTAGLRVAKMGTSSVRYEVGLFRNDEKTAAAQGFFVHVYVDEKTRKSVPISDKMRKTLAEITI